MKLILEVELDNLQTGTEVLKSIQDSFQQGTDALPLENGQKWQLYAGSKVAGYWQVEDKPVKWPSNIIR